VAKVASAAIEQRLQCQVCLSGSPTEDSHGIRPVRFGTECWGEDPLSTEAAQAIRKIIPATKIKMDDSSEGLRASLKSVRAALREMDIASDRI